jgi:hypothetical protein
VSLNACSWTLTVAFLHTVPHLTSRGAHGSALATRACEFLRRVDNGKGVLAAAPALVVAVGGRVGPGVTALRLAEDGAGDVAARRLPRSVNGLGTEALVRVEAVLSTGALGDTDGAGGVVGAIAETGRCSANSASSTRRCLHSGCACFA